MSDNMTRTGDTPIVASDREETQPWSTPVVEELSVEELTSVADLEVAFTSSYSSNDVT